MSGGTRGVIKGMPRLCRRIRTSAGGRSGGRTGERKQLCRDEEKCKKEAKGIKKLVGITQREDQLLFLD